MAQKLGFQCKAYYAVDGAAGGAWLPLQRIRETVEVPFEMEEIEANDFDSDYEKFLCGLRKTGAEFTLKEDPASPSWLAIAAAA